MGSQRSTSRRLLLSANCHGGYPPEGKMSCRGSEFGGHPLGGREEGSQVHRRTRAELDAFDICKPKRKRNSQQTASRGMSRRRKRRELEEAIRG